MLRLEGAPNPKHMGERGMPSGLRDGAFAVPE